MHGKSHNGVSEVTQSARLARWASELTLDDIPDNVKKAVGETVLDTVALSIASADTDYGQAVRKASDTPGACTVFGARETRSGYDAALINGTTAHGEDFDNTYEGCPVHSGVVVVPALFAAGEMHQLPAARVALGLAVGVEIMCRLGATAKKAVHSQGFHPTSVLGTVASAVGVGVARGYSAQQLTDTIGDAASMASGIIEYLGDGSWTKRLHAGWAAQCGLRAAAIGGAGFFGPGAAIEGTHGLFKAFAPSIDPDYDALTGELGQRWEAARVAFKPYACGTMTQPFIDCAVRLAAKGIDHEAIESITCTVGEGTVHRLWEPLAHKQQPPTPYAAKFSGPYTVAAGLRFGDAGLAEFTQTAIDDEALRALSAKVNYLVDPDNEYPLNYTGDVTIKLRDGRELHEHQGQLRGGMREPMSHAELIKKCQANLDFAGWSGGDANRIDAFTETMQSDDAVFTAKLLRKG